MNPVDHEGYSKAVAKVEQRFSALRKKHPMLSGYLVFFLRGEQTGIRSTGSEILKDIPDMLIESPAKSAFKAHLKKKPDKEAKESDQEVWKDQLEALEKKLSYNPEARAEIRFTNLNYELIGKLQQDPLVDQDLTPQTSASIRIVLGELGDLQQADNSAI